MPSFTPQAPRWPRTLAVGCPCPGKPLRAPAVTILNLALGQKPGVIAWLRDSFLGLCVAITKLQAPNGLQKKMFTAAQHWQR